MHDSFDYQGFLQKHRIGPYAKTGKLNEGFDPDKMQLQSDLEAVEEMVGEALGNDVSDQTYQRIVDDIQADWSNNKEVGIDVYDFTNQYLMDWVAEARSAGGENGLGGGSRLRRGENNSIWGDDWESVIDRATQKPEPGDDFYSQDKGGSSKAANWQGRTNPALEEELDENAQEDEDGDQVTKGQIYPEPIEVVSMGSNGAVIKVRKPNGEVEDVDFELGPEIEEVDPPYGYEGTIYGEIDGEEYGIAVSLVDMGGAGYDMDLSYDGLTFLEEGPGNQQEDEDGDQVFEDVENKEGSPEDYRRFMDAFYTFIQLKKDGVITQDELDSISRGVAPVYERLRVHDTAKANLVK